MGEGLETMFWVLAIGGTALFVLKTALLLMGADSHGMGDLDAGGADLHDVDVADHGSYLAFKLLSFQAITTFAMGAGWMGLASLNSFGMTGFQAIFLAIAFGAALVLLMGRLMQGAKKLESSGTLDLKNAVGAVGTVYATIPERGRGQIQVIVQGRLVTLDASTLGQALPTGTRVKVDQVESGGTLLVTAA